MQIQLTLLLAIMSLFSATAAPLSRREGGPPPCPAPPPPCPPENPNCNPPPGFLDLHTECLTPGQIPIPGPPMPGFPIIPPPPAIPASPVPLAGGLPIPEAPVSGEDVTPLVAGLTTMAATNPTLANPAAALALPPGTIPQAPAIPDATQLTQGVDLSNVFGNGVLGDDMLSNGLGGLGSD